VVYIYILPSGDYIIPIPPITRTGIVLWLPSLPQTIQDVLIFLSWQFIGLEAKAISKGQSLGGQEMPKIPRSGEVKKDGKNGPRAKDSSNLWPKISESYFQIMIGNVQSLPQHSIWVPLPFSGGDWIPRASISFPAHHFFSEQIRELKWRGPLDDRPYPCGFKQRSKHVQGKYFRKTHKQPKIRAQYVAD